MTLSLQRLSTRIALVLLALGGAQVLWGCNSCQREKSEAAGEDSREAGALALVETWQQEVQRVGLADRWNLKEVAYEDGRPSFTPKRYSGVMLDTQGTITWNDGCNDVTAEYEVDRGRVLMGVPMSTAKECFIEPEDVHYERVKRYSVEGNILKLYAKTQTYTLKRAPFSKLSQRSWALDSITDERTGKTENIGRFRTDSSKLVLTIVRDKTFTFRDLNDDEFTGALELLPYSKIRIGYDKESLERLRKRPMRLDHLTDSEDGYKKTKGRYPTAYAHRLDWTTVTSFELEEGALWIGGAPERSLKFAAGNEMYVFSPGEWNP
jgi:heat shock protein HslJ